MSPSVEILPVKAYKGLVDPDWCPGCGDFGVLRALQTAASQLAIHPHRLVAVSGIGCSSNLPGFIHAYGFHSLHGRALPVATGIKLANPDLNVVVATGDGDGYGIGAGHFVHILRRNVDMTMIVMNNQIYGLTTGQVSPTSEKGMKSKSTLGGTLEEAFNPLALALAGGATFVSRCFSGDAKHMAQVLKRAISHRGFSLVDVFSPCVTYNKINTYAWFKERVYKLEEADHDTSAFQTAMLKAMEWGHEIPLGVFYEREAPTYEDEEPALADGPLPERELGMTQEQGMAVLKDFM
jgi:2-oxoglutarate ferredoxin oxidoreductase subunit beta